MSDGTHPNKSRKSVEKMVATQRRLGYFDSRKKHYLNENHGNVVLRKSIMQFTKDGVLIKEWSHASAIKKELGFDGSAVNRACNGIYKYSKGFIWKFKN